MFLSNLHSPFPSKFQQKKTGVLYSMFWLFAATHIEPNSPNSPTGQATGDLAGDLPDISPGELPGNRTGGSTGVYGHQQHQKARASYQAEECPAYCSHRASDRYGNGEFSKPDAEETPNTLHDLYPGSASQEHPENHHEYGRQHWR
jgi:hypothetical protein